MGFSEKLVPAFAPSQRRLLRQYIGSAHAEKACDLIVAKRQKNRGMHWSEKTADGLAALKTVMFSRSQSHCIGGK